MLRIVKISILLLLLTTTTSAQANTPPQDEEFLPLSKTHLRGRRIEQRDFEKVPASSSASDEQPAVDLKSLVVGELQRVRNEGPTPTARSGNSFKDKISSVRIEGRFEVVAAYTSVSDNYLR